MPEAARRAGESRPRRIGRLAGKLARRQRKRTAYGRPFKRKFCRSKIREMIAYDFETTRIRAGTPRPLYLTAYGTDFSYSGPVDSLDHLRNILETRFLCADRCGCRFVAWNGNNFDVFFIGASLLSNRAFIIRPYLTRGKALRGIKVLQREKTADGKTLSWEFLDGMSMIVGSLPTTLKKFLKTFAPDHLKLDGPDFDKEDFDVSNKKHIAYAERDSEGLYHGMQKAQSIVQEHFEQGLSPTIGNLGIRIFQAHLPQQTTVWPNSYALEEIIRRFVMRGGFCFCARRFEGPIWKYDINQAYAAAMRDALLPAGRAQACRYVNPYAKCAIYRVRARSDANRVPLYVRDAQGLAYFALNVLDDCWITSQELKQLTLEKFSIVLLEGYFWDDAFTMRELVDKLESLRMADPDGPNGAQGSMMKSLGNNGYGKTVESLDGLELQMSLERPGEEWAMYQDESDTIKHIWCRIGESQGRDYHQPQLGAFVTAHVRMEVRRAILQAPDAWLYSDTDCCFFDRAVSLPIDPKKYGFWKVEAEGVPYRIITKKVYARVDGTEKKAKGMNIRNLKMEDFEAWYQGKPPKQHQVQRQNFLAVMTGAEMYVDRIKVGQRLKG